MNSGKPRILICLSSIDRPVVFENPGRSTSQSNQVTDEPPLNVPSSSTSVQCGYVGAAQHRLSSEVLVGDIDHLSSRCRARNETSRGYGRCYNPVRLLEALTSRGNSCDSCRAGCRPPQWRLVPECMARPCVARRNVERANVRAASMYQTSGVEH